MKIHQFWDFVGPINIWNSAGNSGQFPTSGRVNAVAFDPTKKQTWYAGSPNGGVWKTTDSGTTWKPIGDDWPFLHVSSIAVDNSGRNIYVGTEDCPHGWGPGMGVMKSKDEGTTWKNVSDSGFKTSFISRVVVHPDSPNIVLAADFRGFLWRFKDSGKSWNTVQPSQTGWVSIDVGAKDHKGKENLLCHGARWEVRVCFPR